VLDDEADARELVKRVLLECHADVVVTSTAKEAMELITHQPFDVVVSDIGMPGTDGYQFIKMLRALETKRQSHMTPAVALTAYARPEDRRKILVSGFQSHVAKPVDAAELVAVVASQVRRD
jgi:CheY-like chemotaxis protein